MSWKPPVPRVKSNGDKVGWPVAKPRPKTETASDQKGTSDDKEKKARQ